MLRSLLFGLVITTSLACTNTEDSTPDGSYNVTVTGISSDCTDDNSGYQKTYEYQLFSDGADIEIQIGEEDGKSEGFAIGVRSGCTVQYQSAVWLEEGEEGDLRWQITGDATYQGQGGGCDLTDGLDWEGTEIIEVVESLDENIPEGCTYLMTTEGVLLQ
jgi:hypothetical protein